MQFILTTQMKLKFATLKSFSIPVKFIKSPAGGCLNSPNVVRVTKIIFKCLDSSGSFNTPPIRQRPPQHPFLLKVNQPQELQLGSNNSNQHFYQKCKRSCLSNLRAIPPSSIVRLSWMLVHRQQVTDPL